MDRIKIVYIDSMKVPKFYINNVESTEYFQFWEIYQPDYSKPPIIRLYKEMPKELQFVDRTVKPDYEGIGEIINEPDYFPEDD